MESLCIHVVLNVEEAADGGTADWAFVCLHSDDLTAINAQAHVATREDNCVLVRSIAYNALLLAFVNKIGGIIVNSIDVLQVHYLIVVQKFLLEVLEPNSCSVFLELTVSKLNVFAAFACVS